MKNPTPENWDTWFNSKVAAQKFEQRREPHLRYVTYEELFDGTLNRIRLVCTRLPSTDDHTNLVGFARSARRRLWDSLDWLSMQYSAGSPVELLSDIWPHCMAWAEEYAAFHEAYHDSPEAGNHMTPHAALRTEDYWTVALRLTCFGLLTGNAAQMPRVMQFLNYGNEDMGVRDGLLERLVAPFVTGRGTPPDTATRHLPYRKLFKVFDAAPDKRPALMAKYLDEWYHASRREPYIDQHGEADVSFYGYWAWEAAAVTWLLQIDDSSYREMPFYPRDLVDFARNLPAPPATPSAPPPTYAGQSCPRAGYWFTLAQHGSRRQFAQDDLFPEIPSETSKGLTLWQWADDQGDQGTSGQ